ncbi:hypothetical protein VI817_001575 [Penicillium citrinum]|nr:hypothetical protein VI817_001575 [Penicillium citrinum]
MITPVALANIGYRYYIVYTLIGLTYVGSVYFFYPETMGQSLEKLEDLFQQNISISETIRVASKLAKISPDEETPGTQLKAQIEQIEHTHAGQN